MAWQAIAPGLHYAAHQPWPDSALHLLRVDLRTPALRLRVSSFEERGRPANEFTGATLAEAVLNVSFFDRSFAARGHTVSEGQAWPGALAVAASPLLACDFLQRCRIHFETPPAVLAAWFNAVAGTPWLVRAGRPRSADDDSRCEALCARSHPRTALGLDATGRWLFIVLAEGRRGAVTGPALAPLARFMLSLGVHDAINLDGGGSSALFLRGRSVMQRPFNEPAQRRVANVLLIERTPEASGLLP